MYQEKIENQMVYYKSSESMTEIEDNSIDTIVTSPPYNRKKIYSDDEGKIFDDNKTAEEYLSFLHTIFSECYRILKPTGVFFLNIGDAAKDQGKSELVVNSAVDSGFNRIQTIIWIKSFLGKGHYTPSGGDKRLNNLWESIFVLVKNKKEYQIYPKDIGVPYSDKSNIGRYGDADLRDAGNIWFIPYSKTTGKTIKKGHVAPFPIEVAIKCIKLTRAKTVLDPFLGTGSTLAAAKLCKIYGYGYEKFPRKKVIKERILSSNSELLKNLDQVHITDLELTVKYLSKLIERYDNLIDINKILVDSKKEKNQLRIVFDVLNKLQITTKFQQKIKIDQNVSKQIKDFL